MLLMYSMVALMGIAGICLLMVLVSDDLVM